MNGQTSGIIHKGEPTLPAPGTHTKRVSVLDTSLWFAFLMRKKRYRRNGCMGNLSSHSAPWISIRPCLRFLCSLKYMTLAYCPLRPLCLYYLITFPSHRCHFQFLALGNVLSSSQAQLCISNEVGYPLPSISQELCNGRVFQTDALSIPENNKVSKLHSLQAPQIISNHTLKFEDIINQQVVNFIVV